MRGLGRRSILRLIASEEAIGALGAALAGSAARVRPRDVAVRVGRTRADRSGVDRPFRRRRLCRRPAVRPAARSEAVARRDHRRRTATARHGDRAALATSLARSCLPRCRGRDIRPVGELELSGGSGARGRHGDRGRLYRLPVAAPVLDRRRAPDRPTGGLVGRALAQGSRSRDALDRHRKGPGPEHPPPAYRGRTAASRAASRSCSLAFSFAFATAIFNLTYNGQTRVDAMLTNGSDVAVTGSTATPIDGIAPGVATLPGVAAAVPMQHRFAYVGNDLQDLYGIDPARIGDATAIEDAYFANRDARATLKELQATPDGVLVSQETVNDFQLALGDSVKLRLQAPRAISTIRSRSGSSTSRWSFRPRRRIPFSSQMRPMSRRRREHLPMRCCWCARPAIRAALATAIRDSLGAASGLHGHGPDLRAPHHLPRASRRSISAV